MEVYPHNTNADTEKIRTNIHVPSGNETTIPAFECLLLAVYVIQRDKGRSFLHAKWPKHEDDHSHAVPKSRIRRALLHVRQYASMAWWHLHLTNTALILVLAVCWTTKVRYPIGVRDFSILHSVQTGSEAHPASYPMGTWSSFLKDKVAEA
jgi:hypothetical protein